MDAVFNYLVKMMRALHASTQGNGKETRGQAMDISFIMTVVNIEEIS